ncbi:MAG: hypothetical protein A2655_02205 [Candidatus Yanofskybacteria bacterium RIFCSPHIGHO2_01_FULL_43_42]|uniref:Uncharacterized protein n=1 Tax=Candidatus Yanofskybacteria bacterium RIFCSPLOWO2_01_FULL_43_22 TaxID=1802695 RepID=A0A1F8GJ34_9BACT|nr:MAG: hypothetical protein A2655_02205 [Candidatus Yanofskybacteria bacterium RIFCSPHIGHO2_01_FULL_43_42]OGN13280.1 MAG: hypothetical protein A3D48_03110 [Candidatus Yanofskybacteria bacterium RIFCSPHIGHO2_02_FULL_43_17]OGN24696.1 MAG: hypothetical protein A3A13_01335 [Candidatus Yanofskybacteria bacterium RIFCSPLOWO2_01_FULL_43_22]
MNKKSYIIAAAVLIVVVVFWWWSRQANVETPLETNDINQELEGLDVNNLDDEFKEINKEVETL